MVCFYEEKFFFSFLFKREREGDYYFLLLRKLSFSFYQFFAIGFSWICLLGENFTIRDSQAVKKRFRLTLMNGDDHTSHQPTDVELSNETQMKI